MHIWIVSLDRMNCFLDTWNLKYSEFQVNIFSNKRDITKCQKFLHDANNADNNVKAKAIPQVFSKNSHAKNQYSKTIVYGIFYVSSGRAKLNLKSLQLLTNVNVESSPLSDENIFTSGGSPVSELSSLFASVWLSESLFIGKLNLKLSFMAFSLCEVSLDCLCGSFELLFLKNWDFCISDCVMLDSFIFFAPETMKLKKVMTTD